MWEEPKYPGNHCLFCRRNDINYHKEVSFPQLGTSSETSSFYHHVIYSSTTLSPLHSRSLYLFAVPILHYLPVLISIDMAEEASSLHLIHQQLLFDFESFEGFVSHVNVPSQTSTSDSSPSTLRYCSAL
ncbi:hypothetical protein CK203_117008 [Vitis vinifera]|uniref:Uncharacterized protein n=1 Tax=Vitis vinifera TaxID=29760 RepID=A0A438CPB1_VITVI|nr:hypothetical protein CK203_117008 [Vitis vinifera]